jgi:hypothetical protein
MVRVADILRENNDKWSSLWAFDPLNKTLEKGFKKMWDVTLEAKSSTGATLTVETLQKKLESVRDVSQRDTVIAEYKPLIDEMAKSGNQDVKNMAQVLLTNTSARSWTSVWKAFAGITLDSRKWTLKGLEKNPGSEVLVSDVKPEDLNPVQLSALKNPTLQAWLNWRTINDKKAALDQLFDGLPDDPSQNAFIDKLAKQMYDLSQTQWAPPAPATPTAPTP